MMNKNIKSPVPLARIATVVLGVLILIIGLHSHYKSDWTKYNPGKRLQSIKLHEVVCEQVKKLSVKCPSISMEQYFVTTTISTFILSFLGLVAFFFVDLRSYQFKRIDLGYHAVAAGLLLIAGIVLIVSANQINNIKDNYLNLSMYTLRTGEKRAAAVFTFMQSILFGVLAVLIWRQ